MTIIAISSDSYRMGRETGEKAAKRLGYRYLDRELLKDISSGSGITEEKLLKALEKTPSALGMSARDQAVYLAHIERNVVAEFLKDNVVCHGLAAHLYVLGVSHVLKVRVLSNPQDLGSELAQGKVLSREVMDKLIRRNENARKRWSLKAFSLDETDPSNYDMVISLNKIEMNEAVKSIAEAAGYKKFKAMSYSLKCLKDEEIAAEARTILFPRFPDAQVRANGPTVVVITKGMKREKQKKALMIKEMVGKIPGVNFVEVHVVNDILRQAAESFS
jgi:cytidylate kinase